MKFIVTIICSALLAGCTAAIPIKPEESSYQKVMELPGQAKSTIYEKSLQWVSERFKSEKKVIEYSNKEEGIIIGNGSMPRPTSVVHISGDSIVTYTMKEEIKDGKARLTFSNYLAITPITHNALTMQVYDGSTHPVQQGDLEGIQATFDTMASNLQDYIISKKTDW